MSIVNFGTCAAGDSAEAQAASGTFSIGNTVTAGSWNAYTLRTNPTTIGSGHLAFGAHNGTTGSHASTSVTNSYIFLRFRVDLLPSADSEPFFASTSNPGTTEKLTLRMTSGGVIAAYSGGTTLLATGTTTLNLEQWYELKIMFGTDTGAAWEVYIDDVLEISGTANFSANPTGLIRLGKYNNRNGRSVDYYYADWYWSDSAYPANPVRVSLLIPNAAGTYQTWSQFGVGTPDNYYYVSQVPHDGDTTYLLSTLNVDDAETEALQGYADVGIASGDTIFGVKSFMVVKRDVAGAAMRHRFRSGSTNSDTSSNLATGSAYSFIGSMHNTDPATSAAWVATALDSLESGGVEKDTVEASRMTLTGAMVAWSLATSSIPPPTIPLALLAM